MLNNTLSSLRASQPKTGAIWLFLDPTLPQSDSLVPGITPGVSLRWLNPTQDGIPYLTQQLAGHSLQSLHLISHGSPQGIQLGSTQLTLTNLGEYKHLIAQWKCEYILIYGCQVGQNLDLLQEIHRLTGAVVAAASQEVGPQWQLDVVVGGELEVPLAITAETRDSYPGVLASFLVTTTADEGEGSLRQAIEAANETEGADEISFDPSLAGGVIALTEGRLQISDEVIISGLGAEEITIDAQGNPGVFYIYDGDYDSRIEASLSGLTITGSNYLVGVFNRESLTITDSSITGNQTGGIRSYGQLTITNSTISGNSGYAGGILNNGGQLTITNSTISGNSSSYDGGGIGNGGQLTITNSTISGNSSDDGGGISNFGQLTITNSTISGNSANDSGGGILNFGQSTITNSTITLNQAPKGGGLASPLSSTTTELVNTIIAGNQGSDVDLLGVAPNPTDNIISGGNNLIGSGNALAAFIGPGDAPGVRDPKLASLADNGGPTLTHALLPDSPAINAGNNSLVPSDTDQRGEARIQQGFVDIGAFESDLASPLPLISLVTPNAIATEEGLEGVFQLNRTGDPSEELVISVTASVSEGLDSSEFSLSGLEGSFPNYTVIIPAGEYASGPITLTPLPDDEREFQETFTLNLEADPGYIVNTGSANGTVTIVTETIVVSNTNDSATGSLREAISLANAVEGNNIIEFDPSLAGETIELTTGELAITDNLIITGLGAEEITIDAQGNSGVFDIDGGDYYSEIEVTLSGLTITGGGNDSAGVFSRENLTITDSSITGNQGNGIVNSGELTISNSNISGNSANGYGGGILNRGELTISNSTISGNSSSSRGYGGGIRNTGESLTITNSTISSNIGQGISNYGNGDLTIANTTITLNQYGGLSAFSRSYDPTIKLTNTIIAGNQDSDVDLPFGLTREELTNLNISGGNNLIGLGSDNDLAAFIGPGDAPGVTEPRLAPLADNGGPTLTHALLPDSPAINAGNNSLVPSDTDQRGEARIQQGFVDIGAFESDLASPLPLISLVTPNAIATEEGLEGVFQLNRTGDPTEELVISVTASVSEGLDSSDFNLSGVEGSFPNYTVTIPAGEYASGPITLTPLPDDEREFQQTFTLNLEADPSYIVNTGSVNGTVTIVPETLIVTNINDSGPGSLREAISLANAVEGNNIIEFDPSLAGETIELITTGLTPSELEITDNVVITGLGAEGLTIDGQGYSGVFNIDDGDSYSQIEVTLSGLTITGGGNYSAGVFNRESLTITDSTITGNQSRGISNSGELTITNSTISDNSSNYGGGGIDNNSGELTITNSTISGNSASDQGGGISNRYGGELTIINGTISDNSSNDDGGGIFNRYYGQLTITNSTISGNSASDQGGGISNSGELTITNSTITLNQAPEGSGLASYSTNYSSATVELANTIISGNQGSDIDLVSYEENPPNNITSSGGNLIGTGNALDAFNQPTDQTGITNPGLEPLADNGGPTLTHALLPDSPALDAGDNSLIPDGITTDQRGLPRISGDVVDIGSFELQEATGPQNLLGTPGRDTLVGGEENDSLTGFQSRDILTGGSGSDQFILTSVLDGVDIITDFAPGTDTIVLSQVLSSLGYDGSDPIGEGYLLFNSTGPDTVVQLDPDGSTGDAIGRNFLVLANIGPEVVNNPSNFLF